MPEYEQTGTVTADPDTLFDYLADVEHLPDFLPVITDAEITGHEHAAVTTDIHGEEGRAEGWLRVDALDRRMEWGTPGSGYSGWLQVDPTSEAENHSVVTIHVTQSHASDADDDLLEAIDNIQRLADEGQI
jgi:hypothetical protein